MKNELFLALTQLAAERNLPQSIVVSAVKEALASAYRKDPAAKGQDILVEVDSETGDVIVKTILNVIEKDAIDEYFECITACSIGNEGMQCITQCVEVHLKNEIEQ